MATHLDILTTQQREILRELARGFIQPEIRQRIGFARSNLTMLVNDIRRKTGILDMRDANCCGAWLACGKIISPSSLPSPIQLNLWHFYVAGKGLDYISHELGISKDRVEELLPLKRAKCSVKQHREELREEITFAEKAIAKAMDPMNDPAFR